MRTPFLVQHFLRSLRFWDVTFPGGPQLPGLGNLALMEEEAEPEAPAAGAKRVARAQQGDGTAFESLYREYSPRVYSLCLWMLGDESVAEDLTQDAFLRTFRKIPAFGSDTAFSTWLHRTAVDSILRRLQESASSRCSCERTPADESQGHDVGGSDWSGRLPIDRSKLGRAIGELSVENRLVFVLHDVLGYPDEEIAALLEFPRECAKPRLQQARMQLRTLLRKAEPDAVGAEVVLKQGERV